MKSIIVISIFHFSFLIYNCFAQQSGWEIVPSGTTTELNSIFFYDYEVGFAVGNSGTVLKSIDSGKTWQTLQTPTTFNLNDLYMFHRDTILVVGDSGTMFFSDSGGISWNGGQYMPEDILSVSFSGGDGICGCISQTILYCEYTGTSLTCMTVQTGLFGGGFWGAYMLSPQFGFVAGENSIFQPLLGRTTDSGFNWNFTAFYLNNNEGRATGVDFTDLNTGYISASVWDGTGAIAKTTDNGYNWVTTFFSNPLWSVDFPISGASQVGYAVGSQGTIVKTYDAGINWLPQQSGTILKLNKVHFIDLDFGFAVGDGGIILRTTEGGVPVELTSFSAIVNEREIILNWTTATETNNRGFEVEKLFGQNWAVIGFVEGNGTTTETKSYSFRHEDLEAGIHKYRLKQIDYDGTFEYSENVEAKVTAPVGFELSQNYPNPFNPSTKIKFTIPAVIASEAKQSQLVTLKVYDVLGNEITTLVNEVLSAGEYEIEFSPESSIKHPASGIYFYQLKAGSFIQTKKMLMIK